MGTQERLWFLDQMTPDTVAYNVSAAFRVRGDLYTDSLEAALGYVFCRHEALRLRLATEEGRPAPTLWPTSAVVPLRHITFADHRDADEDALRGVAVEELAIPFDLANEPLFRACLLRLDDTDHLLMLTFHHAVIDKWSIDLVLQEMATAYGAHLAGTPLEPTEPTYRYFDYTAWLAEHLALPAALAGPLRYWSHCLSGIPPLLDLCLDHARPVMSSHAGASQKFAISASTVSRMRFFAVNQGATLFVIAMTAFVTLLSRHSGRTDIVVGVPVAGRYRPELETMVGLFVNTLPIRVDLSGQPAGVVAVDRVAEALFDAFDNATLPFERLVEIACTDRDPAFHPLVQVSFQMLHHGGGGTPCWPGLRVTPWLGGDEAAVRLDLELTLEETVDGELLGLVSYRTDLFETANVDDLVDQFLKLLSALVDAPHLPIGSSASPPVSSGQRGPRRDRASSGGDCLGIDLPKRAPRSTAAVISARGSLTYGELDARMQCERHPVLGDGELPEYGDELNDVLTLLAALRSRQGDRPRRLAALAGSALRCRPLRLADRTLVLPAAAGIAGCAWLLEPLMAGTTVVLAGEPGAVPPEQLVELMIQAGVDGLLAAPSGLRQLIKGLDGARFPELRLCEIATPEPLPPNLLRRARASFPRARLLIRYAMPDHELLGWADAQAADSMFPPEAVFRPSATSLVVLDRVARGVPTGVVGELHTAVAGGEPIATGQFARTRRDGTVQLLGPVHDRIAGPGRDIYPHHVEGRLLEHPAVEVAAVVESKVSGGTAAYLQLADTVGIPPTAAEMRRFLSGRLPKYQIPELFVPAPVPLTTAGVPDRAALRNAQAAGKHLAEEPLVLDLTRAGRG
ncbi:condensation domain-containing protein [Dactylosporangium sp. NPDC050588]|uniref:condensation domain-containing protein n=1 Tax=Dactylosporangium sp. NPDC050588 TaxID=3157211 RepID=UPI0033C95B22